MNPFTRILLLIATSLALTACGADDHGHPHNGDADHAHPPAGESGQSEAAGDHAHGGDTHTHDASETESFYGDDAAEGHDEAHDHGH